MLQRLPQLRVAVFLKGVEVHAKASGKDHWVLARATTNHQSVSTDGEYAEKLFIMVRKTIIARLTGQWTDRGSVL